MLIETKLAIQCKTQVFLARRGQYIVVVENNRWRQRSCAPMRKYASVACLFMSALNDIYKNKKFESNTEIENTTVDVKLPRRMYRWMISEECIWHTMRKKCHYSELFWSTFFPHPAFGLDTSYLSVFSPKAGKCGKNTDQHNCKYGHF